jgi:anaphase-promoting complex subunit 3
VIVQDKELSGLAHELVERSRGSAEAWCVVGNSFSAQKDHDVAQRFFERALQVRRA